MKYETLDDVFMLKLKSLYDIEAEILKALPKMAKKASNKELKNVFQDHLKETKNQKQRLEKVFKILKKKPQKTKVEGIRGLINDASWLMKENMGPGVKDASLISAAQYIEHYERAGYGSARSWAEELGYAEIAELLNETKIEEENADTLLNSIGTRRGK